MFVRAPVCWWLLLNVVSFTFSFSVQLLLLLLFFASLFCLFMRAIAAIYSSLLQYCHLYNVCSPACLHILPLSPSRFQFVHLAHLIFLFSGFFSSFFFETLYMRGPFYLVSRIVSVCVSVCACLYIIIQHWLRISISLRDVDAACNKVLGKKKTTRRKRKQIQQYALPLHCHELLHNCIILCIYFVIISYLHQVIRLPSKNIHTLMTHQYGFNFLRTSKTNERTIKQTEHVYVQRNTVQYRTLNESNNWIQ